MAFTHLHTHTEYSLLDGSNKIKEYVKRVKELGGMTSITTKWTQSNKETRIIANSGMVKSHVLFKDESLYPLDREYRDAMSQLCSYSMMGKNKHDDFPDVLSLFVDWQLSDRANIATVMKRPF